MLQIPETPDGKLELAESLISHNYNNKSHQLNSILTNSQYKPIETTSGRSKWNDNKIFVSDPRHTPKLAHIQLEVSARQHSKPDQRLTILALHDSGCAKSVMNESTFNSLLTKGFIQLKQPPQPTMVVTCTGASEQIEGTADIYLHFTGENGTKMTVELNIVVHSSIQHQFLLGRDFTGSDYKIAETNTHIYFSRNYEIYWHDLAQIAKNKNICDVKLFNTQNTSYRVAANHTTWIAPFSLQQIKCHIPKADNRSVLPLRKYRNGHIFEVMNSSHPNLITPTTMSVFSTYQEILIPVINNTHEDLYIEKATNIAEIQIHNDEMDISFCTIRQEKISFLNLQHCYNTNTRLH